jgi:flagellar biosynthesis/type III secretory pathway M-ring protein FliF/YscJ
MDAIKEQLAKITQQLGGLSASQKMLAASLVAIIVMTMIWWARYAGVAEMEPVFDHTFAQADQGQVISALSRAGISARIIADRIMVPADRKLEAVAALAYADALPSNASAAWDEMFKQMSPWDSSAKTHLLQNNMRERMLSGVIAGFSPGVKKANVIINDVKERRVGGGLEPSASVQIVTNGREFQMKKLVDAAAATVASAVPGLLRSRVSVVVDGMTRRAQDPTSDFGGADLYEQIQAQEKYATEKILSVLAPSAPGALVAVTVDLETISTQERIESFDPSKSVSKEKVLEETKEESTQAVPASAEPGAVPNAGLSISSAPAAPTANTTTIERNRTETENFVARSTKTTNTPAGKVSVVSAAVRIPRSYFFAKFKASNSNANAKDPDETALRTMVTAEIPEIKKVVQSVAGMKSADNISVDMYYDGGLPMLAAVGDGAGTGVGGTGSRIGALVSNHAKEIALGILALMSLFMVATIVRKGNAPVTAGAPLPSEFDEPRETPRLGATEDVAGIVSGDGNSTLDAMELDEEAVKAQQMVEQVATMVKENPDAAANLVKRWLNR